VLNTNYLEPTGREEAWRFTPMKRLGDLHSATTHLSLAPNFALDGGRDGKVELSTEPLLEDPQLLTIQDSLDAVTRKVRREISQQFHLVIPAESEMSHPIHLYRKISETGLGSRLLIEAKHHSRSTLILHNSGDGSLAEEIEVHVADGAALTVVMIQEWGRSTAHLCRFHTTLAKDAQFDSIVLTLGGDLVRILPSVEFLGEGAQAQLEGLYFATDGQHLEHRIFIDHNNPRNKSRVNYKGALVGNHSHTVWFGDVLIRSTAEGTDTYELNRNLLLSDGARADSVPNLEIETGEIIGAGHASTTGRFDDEQLFYLMSRGIDRESAKKLVIRGYFAEIIGKIPSEEIQNRITTTIDHQLVKAGS
jgi:Fe-S cluster assembly protein SufD